MSAVSGVELPREENRGPTQDLVVLPQPPDLGLQALDLGRLLAGHARTGSVVDLGLGQPAPHGLARDALLTGDRGHRRSHGGVLLGVLAHEPHAPRAQLGIDLLRHAVYPLGLKQQRHQTRDGSEGPMRSRAVGVWTVVGVAGGAVGNVVGGTLTQLADWRWVFWLNVPLGVLAVAASAIVLQGPTTAQNSDLPGTRTRRLDLRGAALATAGLVIAS